MRSVRWGALLAISVLVVVGVAVAAAPPAAAHPFGPPPVARVMADGARVDVRWSVAPDDVVALGYHTGAIPSRRTFVFEDGAPVDAPGEVGDDDAALVAASPEVAAYLTDGFRIRQDGRDCDGRVTDASDLDGEGAHLTFTCPELVRTVELEVTLLTDVHPAYRTVLLAEGEAAPERSIATQTDPTQVVTFGEERGGAGGAPVTAAAVAAVALTSGGALLWRRHERPSKAGHEGRDE